ncbi:MAG: hypothetical protein ACOX5R_09970 [bacterium]
MLSVVQLHCRLSLEQIEVAEAINDIVTNDFTVPLNDFEIDGDG